MVEVEGCDASNYQTVRRTEYAALVAEQVLAAEKGGLLRNPWGAVWRVTIPLKRCAAAVELLVFDHAEEQVERRSVEGQARLEVTIPPGGRARWLLEDDR